MGEVRPLTLASWRLQATALLLAPGFWWQWRNLDGKDRQRFRSSLSQLWSSGICLALHFGFWVWGLQHTSLSHSLVGALHALSVCTGAMVHARGAGCPLLCWTACAPSLRRSGQAAPGRSSSLRMRSGARSHTRSGGSGDASTHGAETLSPFLQTPGRSSSSAPRPLSWCSTCCTRGGR